MSVGARAADYVFMYSDYIFGQSTSVSTDFIPNNCIYTGTSGSMFQNANGNYIVYANNSVAFSTTTGSNLTINNNYLYYNNSYYLRYSNTNKAWQFRNKNNAQATAYTVTASANINDFTVSGDATITTTGTNSSYAHANAEYYDIYTFSSLTYYSTDASAAASTTAPTSDLPTLTDGYTWTISTNTYATVDSSTGAITVNSLPTSDTNVTLTCSVTRNGVTKSATKTVTLKAPNNPTAITASDFAMTVGTDDEISYTLTGTSPVYDNVVGTSSNTGIFTVVSDPATGGQMTLHPVAAGSATLTLTAKKQDGTTAATATVTVTVGEAGLYVVVNRKTVFGQNGDGSSASGITSNYYLYPTSSSDESVLKVNYLFTPDRIWRMNPAAYTTTMQNYATGFYIRHTEDAEAEGSVKMDEVDAPTATTYRYRFEPLGDYYAIKPYQYISRNQNQNSSFNPYANNNRAIGMYQYSSDIASQWLYYPVTITDVDAVLGDFTVSGTDVLYATGASDAYTHTNLELTIPYTTYTFNGADHNWYNDADNGANAPSAEIISTGYTWSLSTNSYATVDANTGIITVNSLPTSGNAEVTLTCTMTYGTYTKTATKTVTIAGSQNPTNITTSDKTLTVGTDDDITYTLTTTGNYTPYDLVYATSSDESIFTVVSSPASGGTVTLHPVTPGNATLTLTAKQTDGTTDACSTTVNITVGDKVSTPTITYVLGETNTTVTITCATEGASIYYTTDGSAPTTSSTLYEGAFTISSSSLPKTVKAIAVKTYYTDSEIAEKIVNYGSGTSDDPYIISSVSDLDKLATYPSAYFEVANDFDASSFGGNTTTFTGHLDGDFYKISGLTHPLFNRATGATIKNVALDNVSLSSSVTVSGTTCLGAIAAYADGNTKIYNCGILATTGSSVRGGDNTGSLVGYITDDTRVVNNYSYANVRGEAGIVGHVAGTALANSNYSDNNHCAVTNNMFYGDLTSGTSPVYGGNHTSNVQNTNEYNYWRSRATVSYNDYNNQLAIDKDSYLNRFPFYRHIQNTHRELAAIYLFGSRTDENVAEIGHWYNVKNDEKVPYPIIEEWKTNTKRTTVDIAANLPSTTEKYKGKLLSSVDSCYTGAGVKVESMGTNGYLTVNVSINGSNYSSQLPITDMDTLNYDFTWGKVVLPHANEYEGWTRDYSKICTGWKITGITGGTVGTLTNYNFADRDCTAKDLYSNSNYIFAQGGNYIVPYGVTAINIEANFANAFYLSDAYYDYGYDAGYANTTGITTTVPTTYHGKTVYTSLSDVISQLSSTTDPHTQAIVLVGNFHYNQNVIGTCFNTGKAATIMSVDEDCNQEPDYGWYSYHTTDRTEVPPIRFDFVPNIGIGMAARTTDSNAYPTIGIWHAHGWFELTETCVSIMNECEMSKNVYNAADDGKGNNRWIANSGYFLQIVYTRGANCENYSYTQIGGNAYVEQFYPGPHVNNTNSIKQCPVVVTGGEIEECYMTGKGASSNAKATGSDIYFWCAGGRIHKYLSAFMVVPSNTAGVNVTAKVDHARIYRFFGGGTSPSAPITGNINITMNNSLVDFYCGGPEFGDMTSGKTVTTNAIGSTFGQYYGAGFGGTAITYVTKTDHTYTYSSDYPFNEDFANYTNDRLVYSSGKGYGTCYDFDYILYSGGGGKGVGRIYVGYADFSLAQTGNVTNTLQHCTVLGDYYGAGCQGTVAGTVTSTLTSCTLMQNAFGGGYKASANTLSVYPTTQPTYSTYIKETGIFSDFGTVEPETFTWQNNTSTGSDETNKILYTTTDMTQLGNVTGAITLDIKGGRVAENVYGGGNESPSRDNTTVTIEDNASVGTNVYGGGNVAEVDKSSTLSMVSGAVAGALYGGGNQADVGTTANVTVSGGTVAVGVYGGCNASGSIGTDATVTLTGGTIGTASAEANVHGGGYGAATGVTGNVTVNIQGSTIYGDVYGGSALGNVNTDTSNSTAVNLTGGLIYGDAYGGGLGDSSNPAYVYGNVTVTLNGTAFELSTTTDDAGNSIPASGRVFGCNNINGTPKGTVLVKVLNTVALDSEGNAKAKPTKGSGTYELEAVYGGGNLAAYDPTDPLADGQFTSYTYGGNATAHDNTDKPVQVVIDACDLASIEYVYGGGNAAPTPSTDVTIIGSYEIGNVFGGGNGKDKYTLDGGTTWNANGGADVGVIDATAYAADNTTGLYGTGDASANVLGGTVHYIYGGSNTKGNIVGEATAFLDQASDCPLVVDGIYGGGNEAYMDGNSQIVLGCINYLKELYGGSRNADVGGDINLTITSGHFDRVFGGNNEGGCVKGSITLNIEETGCNPITIGELYGGGNKAAYSVYGYDSSGACVTSGTALYADPVINIRSFTSIGRVFVGGLGEDAIMYGNPTININEVTGGQASVTDWTYINSADSVITYSDGSSVTLPVRAANEIGAIGTVFGGGNAAVVQGNTTINIGTEQSIIFKSPETKTEGGVTTATTDAERTHAVEGVDIRGNVYGGGNAADVKGSTNVVVGQ